MDRQDTDVDRNAHGKWKRVLKRISTTLLGFFGLLFFTLMLYEQFEGHADFWELSLFETLFWGAFLFLSVRLYTEAKQAGASITRMLYLPLRNMGFAFLSELLIIVVAAAFLTGAELKKVFLENATTHQNLDQAIYLAIVLLCIHLAARALRKGTPSRLTNTYEHEATEN